MRSFTLYIWVLVLSLFFGVVSCKKSETPVSFTASINNTTYTFDSLFSWIDTSNASFNLDFVQLGAVNTQTRDVLLISANSSPRNTVAGTYFYYSQPPYPLPANYKSFLLTLVLNNGSIKGRYTISDTGVSRLFITSRTKTNLQGNLSFTISPAFVNGLSDNSTTLSMSGQFNVLYKVIP